MTPRFESEPYDPKPGGILFGPDQDWWHNAVISRFHTSWYMYAEGYRRAANLITESITDNRHYIDFFIYPVVFLYRQYIELSLKALLRDSASLLDRDMPKRITHNLLDLWNIVEPLLEESFGTDKLKEGKLQILSNCFRQFSNMDPTSETFRYPVRKDGTPADYQETHVNIRQLRIEMDNAAKVIENIGNYLVVMLDQKQESESYWEGP